jgi:acid phosphatase type 7
VIVWVPEVLVRAGDIAECLSSGNPATALLLDEIPGTVFTAGDNAFPSGSDENYANCWAVIGGHGRSWAVVSREPPTA